MGKPCSKCGELKDGSDYYRDSRVKKDGLMAQCKECYCAHYRNTYQDKKEYRKTTNRQWYQNNKKRKYEKGQEWRKNNPNKVVAMKQRYRSKEENVIKERKALKIWQQQNYIKWRAQVNLYYRNKYANDLDYKLSQLLRNRLRYALFANSKDASALDLLGCSVYDLIGHLESQFQEGMTWENWNYDGWHVDHIVPCAAFDLSDPEQQKLCFNYTNLRPLWAGENHSKGKKLPHEYVQQ